MTKKQLGLVLLSGGLDSTTATAWALSQCVNITAITFDYGQMHRRELEAASTVAARLGVYHNTVDVSFYRELAAYSALTQPRRVAMPTGRNVAELASSIPSTYVPMRNTFILTMAVAWLESRVLREIEDIGTDPSDLEVMLVIGVNAVDYSGYPDCRPEFYDAISESFRLGSKIGIQYGLTVSIKTPLMAMTKAEIINKAMELNAPLDVTWSCYNGEERPCGICDACVLRAKGFKQAGVSDPAIY